MQSFLLRMAAAVTVALTLVTPAAAESSASASNTTLTQPEEKKICRASVETGSLIKKRKTCLTRAQWVALDDQHEREAKKMIEDNTIRPQSN